MRWIFVGLGACIVTSGLLLAVPAHRNRSGSSPTARSITNGEAAAYANELAVLVGIISQRYVRPIPTSQLVEAALTGLYETAQTPVPTNLRADLKRSVATSAWIKLAIDTRLRLGACDALQGTQAIFASSQAMMRLLDPYSGWISEEEARWGYGQADKAGVGVELTENIGAGPLVIATVFPGGPAQEAGLRPGDVITRIDGKKVHGLNSLEALRWLNFGLTENRSSLPVNPPFPALLEPGYDGSSGAVRATIQRGNAGKSLEVSMARRAFEAETMFGVARNQDNSWNYWLDPQQKLAQIRIARLDTYTASNLESALHKLRAAGLRGLILDLRWCPGGFLLPSEEAARLLVREDKIDSIHSRIRDQFGASTLRTTRGGKFLDFPIVALINAETSGGAELVAAALQDYKRAKIIGQRSKGKGSIQSTFQMNPRMVIAGKVLKLTTGAFIRPSGKNLHRFSDSKLSDDWGVVPDPRMECRISAELNRRLKEEQLLQTLRPGWSKKFLPLDDPISDPQQQFALRVLKTEIAAVNTQP